MIRLGRQNMNIYLDTEFTQFQRPRLLSIGLCSENSKTFYAQMNDGWELSECSEFVRSKVLSQFEPGAASMLRSVAAQKLGAWLQSIRVQSGRHLTIISDFDVDSMLMQELLQSAEPAISSLIGSYRIKRFPYAQIDDVMAEFGGDELLLRPSYSAHHALHDARMLRLRAHEEYRRTSGPLHQDSCCMQL